MAPNDRASLGLATADALYGAITMPVVEALLPDVQPSRLRHLLAQMVDRGAVVSAWAGGTGRKVWLTTRPANGRLAGVRRWIADPSAVRDAIACGRVGGTLEPPSTFDHDMAAGQVTSGYGVHGHTFDSELRNEPAGKIGDGIAFVEADWRLLIEVERMVNQNIGRWQKAGGLIEKIVAALADNSLPGVTTQHLVVSPRTSPNRGRKVTDFESELAAAVTAKASGMHGIPEGAGWWFLPIDDLTGDPRWHPISAETAEPRSLPGIAKRRAVFDAIHEQNASIDADAKARAAARRAGVRVPRGVTFARDAASSRRVQTGSPSP